jgi:hypothetical protein
MLIVASLQGSQPCRVLRLKKQDDGAASPVPSCAPWRQWFTIISSGYECVRFGPGSSLPDVRLKALHIRQVGFSHAR